MSCLVRLSSSGTGGWSVLNASFESTILTDTLDLDSTAWDTPYVFAQIGLMKRDLAMLGYDFAMEQLQIYSMAVSNQCSPSFTTILIEASGLNALFSHP